ncbi:MAG: MerR family transcriptional regulator [Coriobacteriia bacterium]
MPYTVSDVARTARVSVRTLHHYDEIGLLHPSERTDAGYRLYTDQDLELLQQVLFFKELGFELGDIRGLITGPGYERAETLAAQREWLSEKRNHLDRMIASVDKALAAIQEGIQMDKEEMFEVWGDFDPAGYEDEVKERWGETDAYKESARRTKRYAKDDWVRINAEGAVVYEKLTQAFDQGLPVDSDLAQQAVQAWWDQVDRNFYTMTLEILGGLGEMYVQDARFAKHYEDLREGLAVYWRDAIRAYVAVRR